MILPNVLMIVGGLAWLVGELIGVFTGPKKRNDTTSQWVWWLEARWPVLRVAVGVFAISLVGHLLFGWTLLP